ncbi:MAG: YcxB family protein [Oscillospiraceae bacterium]
MYEFSTKLGKEEVLVLNKFHTFKKSRWVMIVIGLLFVVLGIIMFFDAENTAQKIVSLIFIVVLGGGYPFLIYGIVRFVVWLQIRSSTAISDDNKIEFCFNSEEVTVKSNKPDMTTTTNARWNLVYKAYETKTHYFFYISNMQAYIIPKESIKAGSCEGFSALVKEKLGGKFKYK